MRLHVYLSLDTCGVPHKKLRRLEIKAVREGSLRTTTKRVWACSYISEGSMGDLSLRSSPRAIGSAGSRLGSDPDPDTDSDNRQ
jgi:hypothetical protein